MHDLPSKSAREEMLIIGYGNDLRSDDGAGPRVAVAVAGQHLPGVRAISCHQLTPELAEEISHVAAVVFVDAAVDGSTAVRMRILAPSQNSHSMAHTVAPQSLLGLAKEVFGRCPPAWWLTIPVENTGFGQELSALARQGVHVAVETIQELAKETSSP